MGKLLDMAESKHAGEDVRDVKIGRPRVRGLDILRDPLLNKVRKFYLKFCMLNFMYLNICLVLKRRFNCLA